MNKRKIISNSQSMKVQSGIITIAIMAILTLIFVLGWFYQQSSDSIPNKSANIDNTQLLQTSSSQPTIQALSNIEFNTEEVTLKNARGEDVTGLSITGFKSQPKDNISLLIPDTINGKQVIAIGTQAFSYNFNIVGLVLPEGLIKIGAKAFDGCLFLTGNLNIPQSVTTIETSAFDLCKSLQGDLNIPQNVTTIGSSAFANCLGLEGELTISNSVKKIEKNAFSYTTFKVVDFSNINTQLVIENDTVGLPHAKVIYLPNKNLSRVLATINYAADAIFVTPNATEYLAYVVDWKGKDLTYEVNATFNYDTYSFTEVKLYNKPLSWRKESKNWKVDYELPEKAEGFVRFLGWTIKGGSDYITKDTVIMQDTEYYSAIRYELPKPTIVCSEHPNGDCSYNGGVHNLVLHGSDNSKINVNVSMSVINAGQYKFTVTLKDKLNCVWEDASKEDLTLSYYVAKAVLAIPNVDDEMVFNLSLANKVVQVNISSNLPVGVNAVIEGDNGFNTQGTSKPGVYNVTIKFLVNNPDNFIIPDPVNTKIVITNSKLITEASLIAVGLLIFIAATTFASLYFAKSKKNKVNR